MNQLFPVALSLVALACFCCARAQGASTEPTPPTTQALEMKLWPGDPPGFVPATQPERNDGTGRIWNVSVPGLLVYLPPRDPSQHRTAIIVCPSGGYTHLTRLFGGDGAVNAFVPKQIAVIALKYRLSPPTKDSDIENAALADVQRAIQTTRMHASEWGIDPHRVGVMGWSAGANAALNAGIHFKAADVSNVDPIARESTRPDFIALLSPWPHKHDASAYPVPSDAPPAFIGSALDDKTAPCTFAQGVAAAFEKAGVKVSLWLVPTGGHGAFSINAPDEGGRWVERFLPWLKQPGEYNN